MAKRKPTSRTGPKKQAAKPSAKPEAAKRKTTASAARSLNGRSAAVKSKSSPLAQKPKSLAKVSAVRQTKLASKPAANGDVDSKPFSLRKTNLSPAELDEFRQLLMEKRRELVGDMAHLTDAAQGGSGEASSSSSMPIHMADLGTDTWEQELTLGLIENERGLLREIDEALNRIQDRTYGICIATNRPISKARLRAKPWAKYCIEYARKRERGLT